MTENSIQPNLRQLLAEALAALNIDIGAWTNESPGSLAVRTPITGGELLRLKADDRQGAAASIAAAHAAFLAWRDVPAPARGGVARRLGELLREHKTALATLVTLEAGKITTEALGEVQEMIDICDFAVGLSRQLYGKTIASERPGHTLRETWHPLGVVGVISAFNFPVAVWAWNTALALVCGDAVVWKPSELTPLTAIACHELLRRALADTGNDPNTHQLVLGGQDAGEALVDDPRVALVSATGSTRMGREVAPRVAARFGRSLLELGGNNAAIVAPSADLDLALRGVVFAAAGTAGQRCTTLRRLILHESVVEELVPRLVSAYQGLKIGNPLTEGVLVGPLIHSGAYESMAKALDQAQQEGGKVLVGGERAPTPPACAADGPGESYYVSPAIVRMPGHSAVVAQETFAPILYVLTYTELDEAIALNNAVPQGLSSAIFTNDVREAERFLSASGSDCGIANVNIGTSGAEIGGAFGGEKETGGGRESGSDSWKAYMRRSTATVNHSAELPLAQGVDFG
jgi:aldehyde dehydrogenase (NAD+)